MMKRISGGGVSRRAICCLVVCLVVGMVVFPAASSQAGTLRMAYAKIWSLPTVFVGIVKGWFETPTLKTQWIDLRASSKMVEAIFAGSADGGIMSPTTVFLGVERGLDLKMVANLHAHKEGYGLSNGLYVRKDLGITSLQGLKGKKIGISTYGSTMDIETRALLIQAGMDPKKDVQLLEISNPAGVKAINAGRIDAYFFPAGFIPAVRKKNVMIADTFDIKEYKGRITNNAPITISGEFIRKNRETAVQWLTQYLKSYRFVIDNVEESNKIWSKWAKRKKNASIYYLPRDAELDKKGLQATIDLMVRYGYLKKRLDINTIVDMSLIREAKARLEK